MDDIDQSQIGRLDPQSPDLSAPPRKVSRLLLLWPLAGIIALAFAVIKYSPLDDALIWWVGGIPCVIVATVINIAWRSAQSGDGVPSYFPRTVWLAAGCLFVPAALFLNGALDNSAVEQHRQIVTRAIFEHHSRGGDYYYLEVSSWRQNRSHEKVTVSEREYLDSRPGDPIIVETQRGAFGIPLLLSVHAPDGTK